MPDGGKADWQVKCPLCQDEFSLGEMLQRLPPALIVISGPAPTVSAAAADDDFATMFAGESGVTSGEVFELDSSDGEVPSFTLAGDADHGAAVATAPSMSKVTPLPRRKKKEKNVAAELMKIVLGGVAGLLIGFFLLLWVWKKDILNVAPKFPAWAQWALPADLRKSPPSVTPISTAPEANPQPSDSQEPDSATEAPADAMPDEAAPKEDLPADADKPKEATSDGDEAVAKEIEADKPAIPAEDAKEVPKEIEEKPADTEAEKQADAPPPDAKKEKPIDTDDPLDIRPPDSDKKVAEPKIDVPKIDEPKLDEPKIDVPKIDEPKIEEPKIDDPVKVEAPDDKPMVDPTKPDDEKVEPKPDDAGDVGLKAADAATAEQAESALKAADDASKVLTPSDAAQKSAFTPEKYAAYGKLCEAVAVVTRAGEGATSADHLKVMLLVITGEQEHAAVIGQLANAWLARARKNDGIVLVGKVEEVSTTGPLKSAKVQLPALGTKLPAMQVTVVSKDLPELKAGDSIEVAGVIVEKPAEAIKGFKGENARVIWATHVNPRGANGPAEGEKPAEKPAE
jgi:hypothetical protein